METIAGVGVESVKVPPRSDWFRSIKESCLARMIFFDEGVWHKGIDEFILHYHGERNHQGLDNRLIVPEEDQAGRRGVVPRRERLGGTLNDYYRAAA